MKRLRRGLVGAVCGAALFGLSTPVAVLADSPNHGTIQVAHGAINTNESSNWSGYNIGADRTVHFVDATYNAVNPGFETIDELQLDSNDMIEASPSGPGPTYNSFNDCTWASSCTTP